MGIGVGIFLIAIGAILTWGVDRTVSGVDINTIGVILMIVGGVGLLVSLLLSSSMPWRRDAAFADERAPMDDRAALEREETYAVTRR